MKKLLLSAALAVLAMGGAQAQSVGTWAGKGTQGSGPNGSTRANISLNHPVGIAKDSKGRIWVTNGDSAGHVILFHPNGLGYTQVVANNGQGGIVDGRGVDARMAYPGAIAAIEDTLFVVDQNQWMIRKVTPFVKFGATGTERQNVTTFAGGGDPSSANFPDAGYVEGRGTEAMFQAISFIGYDKTDKTIIVADAGNNAIRRITRDGKTSLVAGKPGFGSSSIDGDALSAQLPAMSNFTVASNGDMYWYQEWDSKVRKYTKSTKKVSTLATLHGGSVDYNVGTSSAGFLFDEERSNVAAGNYVFYLANECKVLSATISGTAVTTKVIAGQPGDPDQFMEDCGNVDGAGNVSKLNRAMHMMFKDDITGANPRHDSILVADLNNHKIRGIKLSGAFTGVNETSHTSFIDVNVYPNPAKDVLNLTRARGFEGKATVEVYDAMGRRYKALQVTQDEMSLNVSDLANGVYILKFTDPENRSMTARFIKQ